MLGSNNIHTFTLLVCLFVYLPSVRPSVRLSVLSVCLLSLCVCLSVYMCLPVHSFLSVCPIVCSYVCVCLCYLSNLFVSLIDHSADVPEPSDVDR